MLVNFRHSRSAGLRPYALRQWRKFDPCEKAALAPPKIKQMQKYKQRMRRGADIVTFDLSHHVSPSVALDLYELSFLGFCFATSLANPFLVRDVIMEACW